MSSFRFLLSRRWAGFTVFVLILAFGTWWLGQWQFDRLADRKSSNQIVRTNEHAEPAPVQDVLAPGRSVAKNDEWRRVTATGTYDVDDTIIWRYRTPDDAKGVDIVVPLVLSDGTAVLVDRGWLQTESQEKFDDLPAPPSGEVTITGWVRADGTGDSTHVAQVDGYHATRALSSTQVAEVLDESVVTGWLHLDTESPEPATELRPADLPELDNGPHFFYGLQWWFFGILAIAGFFYLMYDERRTQSRDGDAPAAAAEDERSKQKAAKLAQKQAVKAAYQAAYEREKSGRS
ncbi:cytochrome oxidase assembly protein ShyY1 [Nocardioides albertanoniae]|uniref:SURF1-like protein n=1 Tax=Nocardioides albertanoniae TaxID=1175486 RepID=A0A543A6F7_9ACTN|nr:SURF1 family protein [Nocardioides albertanoniae]TQL68182.1 cytochrome oxidase assembly protein ShyY1 [Nocardioides albertanoniae]